MDPRPVRVAWPRSRPPRPMIGSQPHASRPDAGVPTLEGARVSSAGGGFARGGRGDRGGLLAGAAGARVRAGDLSLAASGAAVALVLAGSAVRAAAEGAAPAAVPAEGDAQGAVRG